MTRLLRVASMPFPAPANAGHFSAASLTFFVGSLFLCVAMTRRSRGLSESGIRTIPEGLFAGLAKLENL